MRVLKSLLAGAAGLVYPPGPQARDVAKRAGTLVVRKVLNADDWVAWGTKHSIPGLVGAGDMAVTIFTSASDIKMPCDTAPVIVSTKSYRPGVFVGMGDGDKALAFVFSSYQLSDRNWAYAGITDYDYYYETPTFRPHLTLSLDAGDYELPDAALQDVPDSIVLSGETVGPLTSADPTEGDAGVEDDPVEGDTLVVVILEASVAAAATKTLAAQKTLSVFDEQALMDMAAGRRVTKAVLASVAKRAWAPQEIRDAAKTAGIEIVRQKRTVEKQLTMTVGAIPEEMRKKLGTKLADMTKTEEEQHLVWGWASVATIGGVEVEDLQGDTISTDAQRQWLHSLMKGQRGGKFEHEGDAVNEVVEGIVLCKSVQDMLGIDLGMEGVLTCTHVPGVDDWSKVKEGSWMHSIAGTVLVEVEE